MKALQTSWLRIFVVFGLALATLTLQASEADALGYGQSGTAVRRLQQDLVFLGYLSCLPTGYYGQQTKAAVKAFQAKNNLTPDGIAGTKTLAVIAQRVREKSSNLTNRRDESIGLLPWEDVNRLFPRGTTARIWDVATKRCLSVWRLQGTFHADVEPLTQDDTATLLQICGGHWNSARRAILLEIGGRLIAGSMYPYPHGNEAIHNNGFNGQFCLHFLGSRIHKSGRVDSTHQAMVMKAAQASLSWWDTIAAANRATAQPAAATGQPNAAPAEQTAAADSPEPSAPPSLP